MPCFFIIVADFVFEKNHATKMRADGSDAFPTSIQNSGLSIPAGGFSIQKGGACIRAGKSEFSNI